MSTNMFVSGAKSFDEVAVVGENGFAGEGAKVAESKEGNATILYRTVGCLPRNYFTSPEAKQSYDVKNRDVLNMYQRQNDKTVALSNGAENAQKSEGPVTTQGKDIQSDNSVQATTAVTVQGAKPEGFKAKMLARLQVIEDFINSILIALHIKKAPNSEPTNPAPLLNTNQPIPQEAIDQRPEVKESIDQQPEVDSEQQFTKNIFSRPSLLDSMEKGKELNAKALDVERICFKIKELITGECKVHSFDLPKEKQAEVDQVITGLKDKTDAEKKFACNKLILKSLVSFMGEIYAEKNSTGAVGYRMVGEQIVGSKITDLLSGVMKELAPGSRVDGFLRNFEVNRSACPKELVACYEDAMNAREANNYADQEYKKLKAKNVSEEELDAQGKIVNETCDKAEDLLDKLCILARAHLFFEGLNKDEIDNFKSLLSDVITYTPRKSIEFQKSIESLKLFLAKLDPASFEKFSKQEENESE